MHRFVSILFLMGLVTVLLAQEPLTPEPPLLPPHLLRPQH